MMSDPTAVLWVMWELYFTGRYIVGARFIAPVKALGDFFILELIEKVKVRLEHWPHRRDYHNEEYELFCEQKILKQDIA